MRKEVAQKAPAAWRKERAPRPGGLAQGPAEGEAKHWPTCSQGCARASGEPLRCATRAPGPDAGPSGPPPVACRGRRESVECDPVTLKVSDHDEISTQGGAAVMHETCGKVALAALQVAASLRRP